MTNEQAEFWSSVAESYDRVVDQQIGGTTRAMVRERVARESPLGRAVEFGCGTGFFTDALARKAQTLLATDLSPGMLALARRRVEADNVLFQAEDCQHTSLGDGAFDTAFASLVIHFTEPERAVAEMHRILRPGGTLIVVNLDPNALNLPNRIRAAIRILYRGLVGYRLKPPKRFGRNVMGERQLLDLLRASKFQVDDSETIKDPSRSSNIPVQYIRAARI